TPLDAKLLPLADNGGYLLPDRSKIQTQVPAAGSPARDKGSNPYNLNFDERGTGHPRTSGSATDVGAFETAAPIAVAKANNVMSLGGSTFDVTVTFTDDIGVNISSISAADFVARSVVNGAILSAKSVTTSPASGTAANVTATVTFDAPGGVWDATDSGV